MIRRMLKVSVAIMLVISTMLCLTGCGNKKNEEVEVSKEVYEAPLRARMEGLKNKNLEQYLQAYPAFTHMENVFNQQNIDDIYKQYETVYGANIALDYTLSDAVKIDTKDIETLEKQLKGLYAEAESIKIEKAYIITVNLNITGDGTAQSTPNEQQQEGGEEKKSTVTEKTDFYVYLCDGNWYVF